MSNRTTLRGTRHRIAPGGGPRRLDRPAAALLAAGLLATGCATAGAGRAPTPRSAGDYVIPRNISPGPTPSPAPPAPAPAPGSAAPSALPVSARPVDVAAAWLAAWRYAAWNRPATVWIDKVAPLVTGGMNTENQRLRTGSVGAGWAAFVRGRCVSTVTGIGAVVPLEAPATDQVMHVQVAGTVHTVCATGPAAPDEPVAATLTVAATPVGWRVAAIEQQ